MFSSERPGNYFRWFAKHPSGQVCGGIIRNATSYGRILNNMSNSDFYLGLNPSNTFKGIKIGDNQVSEVIGLVLDLDPLPGTTSKPTATPVIEAIESVLGRIPHTYILFTGRGIQLWLRIQYDHLDSNKRILWRSAIKSFTRKVGACVPMSTGFAIDTSCTDLSRLVRAPGSINQKTKLRAELIGELSYPPINPSTFIDTFASVNYLEPFCQKPALSTSWWKHFHLLNHTSQLYLTEGVTEPGRHSAAYAAAKSLQEVGVEESLAAKLVTNAASFCIPPLSSVDALRAVRNAFHSGD